MFKISCHNLSLINCLTREELMKILYAIKGIGNRHISRAREIVPYITTKW